MELLFALGFIITVVLLTNPTQKALGYSGFTMLALESNSKLIKYLVVRGDQTPDLHYVVLA